jgi:hypothetical protein
MSASHPVLFSNRPFQFGSLPATLSMRVCLSSLVTQPVRNVIPKYLPDRLVSQPWNSPSIVGVSVSSYLMGTMSDFWILVHSLVVCPSRCRSCCKFAMSFATGLINRVVSSAYRLVRIFTGSTPIWWRRPSYFASCRYICS